MLPKRIIDAAHVGHLGIEKIKENLRPIFFWPGFSAELENVTKVCIYCAPEIKRNRSQNDPVGSVVESGSYPFETLSIDHFGPSTKTGNLTLLSIIDNFTRFPFVFIVPNHSTCHVINALRQVFSLFGIPKKMHQCFLL